MSILAQMEGLPATAESKSVVLAVRKTLQKLKMRFWVHDFILSEATNTKKCKIEFFNKAEVPTAIQRLTSKPQTINGVQCDLKINILSETNGKSKPQNLRDRSRSPLSKEEANIDKEIEQLKKEKEELEKRKTELLRKKKNIDQDPKPTWITRVDHATLPKYESVENIIVEQMKPLLKHILQKRYYQIVLQRVHVEVRKKLAIFIEETKKFQNQRDTRESAREIVKAFRYKHSSDDDAMVVNKILDEIKMAFWSYKAKNNDGSYDFDESSDEENVAQDKNKAQNGNKGTYKNQAPKENKVTNETEAKKENVAPNENEAPKENEAPNKNGATNENQAPNENKAPSEQQAPEDSVECDVEGKTSEEQNEAPIEETRDATAESQPEIMQTEEPQIEESKEPGDILFEGGSDWNEDQEMKTTTEAT